MAEAKPLIVDRLHVLSEDYSDLDLVGAAPTGYSAVPAASLADPDVVLIEEQLPDADGVFVCEHIHSQLPNAAIILISYSQPDQAMLGAVEAGVCGLISPLASDDELVVTILRAADGEFLISRQVVQRLFLLGRALRRTLELRPPCKNSES